MKDQYVGDINDYVKYSLLRRLSAVPGSRLLVCWLLTAVDGRGDGSRTGYLDNEEEFGSPDPELFSALRSLIVDGRRSVSAVEKAGILPTAAFHSSVLRSSAAERRSYFNELARTAEAEDSNMVFFDPDNGLEVPSARLGRKASEKFLFERELVAICSNRSSIVYQHFPRVPREAYVDAQLTRLVRILPDHSAFAVFSSQIAFFHLVAEEPAYDDLLEAAQDTVDAWGSRLRLRVS